MMISKIAGKLVEKREQSVIININGIYYELLVPTYVLSRIDDTQDAEGCVHLITHHYIQITPSSGIPTLIGFINEIEKDFFQQFITVSGIGPRAAVKALNKPIAEITRAIDQGDVSFLKTLPGIGNQRAKEVIAKLQGKLGKFGLMREEKTAAKFIPPSADWQEEAMGVLLQLQYKRPEAEEMIRKALERSSGIRSAEELLNEIYRQKIKA
jgi:Holliday junction DNA helicase RuvA